ncbi:MAG TPA: glycosyl hydrolase 108 family protein [bacterium]|nr:glycosyl hydrolase 108 family protein [bacterium]
MNETAFDRALARLLEAEGGYVNDPDDAGGETYRGIARRFHPDWPGWNIVDMAKQTPDLWSLPDLQERVAEFYRAEFWSRFRGDDIPDEIAAELLDIAVNLGVHRAVQFLQRALNLWPFEGDWLAVDGIMGLATEARVNVLRPDEIRAIVTILNILQGVHYIERVEDRPVNAKYLKGWLKRVTLERR